MSPCAGDASASDTTQDRANTEPGTQHGVVEVLLVAGGARELGQVVAQQGLDGLVEDEAIAVDGGQVPEPAGQLLRILLVADHDLLQLGELASDRGLARLELADARCRVLAEHLERGGERAVTAGGSTLAGECTCPLGVRG